MAKCKALTGSAVKGLMIEVTKTYLVFAHETAVEAGEGLRTSKVCSCLRLTADL